MIDNAKHGGILWVIGFISSACVGVVIYFLSFLIINFAQQSFDFELFKYIFTFSHNYVPIISAAIMGPTIWVFLQYEIKGKLQLAVKFFIGVLFIFLPFFVYHMGILASRRDKAVLWDLMDGYYNYLYFAVFSRDFPIELFDLNYFYISVLTLSMLVASSGFFRRKAGMLLLYLGIVWGLAVSLYGFSAFLIYDFYVDSGRLSTADWEMLFAQTAIRYVRLTLTALLTLCVVWLIDWFLSSLRSKLKEKWCIAK